MKFVWQEDDKDGSTFLQGQEWNCYVAAMAYRFSVNINNGSFNPTLVS